MKYCQFIFLSDWVTKHELIIVLIELEMFGFIPIGPGILFHKFAPSEFHHLGDDVPNIAINNNVPSWGLGEIGWRLEC